MRERVRLNVPVVFIKHSEDQGLRPPTVLNVDSRHIVQGNPEIRLRLTAAARRVRARRQQQPARLRSDAEVYRLTAEFLQHPAVCASFDILPPQLGAAQVRSTQIESTQMQVTQQTPLTPPQERRA